jgi:Na+-transporting NADH:ubiquinone oxidoreductase subunit NqrB
MELLSRLIQALEPLSLKPHLRTMLDDFVANLLSQVEMHVHLRNSLEVHRLLYLLCRVLMPAALLSVDNMEMLGSIFWKAIDQGLLNQVN